MRRAAALGGLAARRAVRRRVVRRGLLPSDAPAPCRRQHAARGLLGPRRLRARHLARKLDRARATHPGAAPPRACLAAARRRDARHDAHVHTRRTVCRRRPYSGHDARRGALLCRRPHRRRSRQVRCHRPRAERQPPDGHAGLPWAAQFHRARLGPLRPRAPAAPLPVEQPAAWWAASVCDGRRERGGRRGRPSPAAGKSALRRLGLCFSPSPLGLCSSPLAFPAARSLDLPSRLLPWPPLSPLPRPSSAPSARSASARSRWSASQTTLSRARCRAGPLASTAST